MARDFPGVGLFRQTSGTVCSHGFASGWHATIGGSLYWSGAGVDLRSHPTKPCVEIINWKKIDVFHREAGSPSDSGLACVSQSCLGHQGTMSSCHWGNSGFSKAMHPFAESFQCCRGLFRYGVPRNRTAVGRFWREGSIRHQSQNASTCHQNGRQWNSPRRCLLRQFAGWPQPMPWRSPNDCGRSGLSTLQQTWRQAPSAGSKIKHPARCAPFGVFRRFRNDSPRMCAGCSHLLMGPTDFAQVLCLNGLQSNPRHPQPAARLGSPKNPLVVYPHPSVHRSSALDTHAKVESSSDHRRSHRPIPIMWWRASQATEVRSLRVG